MHSLLRETESTVPLVSTLTCFSALFWFSACFLLAYSQRKAFWSDEVLTYFTVARSFFRDMLRFHLTTPVSFEPPTFEMVLWIFGKLFGTGPGVFRLPGIASFLCMQVFLYLIVLRLSNRCAACVASVMVLGLPIVNYGPEIRPYAFQFLCATVADLVLAVCAER